MFGEFFEWWGRQLLDLVPARFRGRPEGADALIVDAAQPGALTLLARRRGTETRIRQIPLDDTAASALQVAARGRPRGEQVQLRLPASAVLERNVTMPLAAERDLERVLGYEMERLTPFTAEEVFWGYGLEDRDRARSRLALRLTIVPRATVAGLMDMLASAGLRPTLLQAPGPGGLRAIKPSHDQAAAGMGFTTRAAIAVAAILLLAVIATPFLRQSLALSAASDKLEALSPRITEVEALRRKIRGAGAGGDAVAAETRRLGDTLEALAAITDILPDDSYLTEFTMRERKMTLSGLAASAPKLISGLSDDSRIRNPAFTAPVTKAETGHNDVFSIRAELAP